MRNKYNCIKKILLVLLCVSMLLSFAPFHNIYAEDNKDLTEIDTTTTESDSDNIKEKIDNNSDKITEIKEENNTNINIETTTNSAIGNGVVEVVENKNTMRLLGNSLYHYTGYTNHIAAIQHLQYYYPNLAIPSYMYPYETNAYAFPLYVYDEYTGESVIAYCYNKDKTYPYLAQNKYRKIENATENDFVVYSNSYYISKENVLASIYYGYPYDAAGLRNYYNLTNMQLRAVTQAVIWYFTDNTPLENASYTLTHILERDGSKTKIYNWTSDMSLAYEYIKEIASNNPTLPNNFELDLFIADDYYNNDGKQNLLSTKFVEIHDEVKDIKVIKRWENINNNEKPNEILIELYANGQFYRELETRAEDNWEVIFDNLPAKTQNGQEIEYTIKEVVPEGYENKFIVEITKDGNNFIITNKKDENSFRLVGKKVLENGDLANYIFKFGIWRKGQENGNPLQTVESNKYGEFEFSNFVQTINNGDQFVVKEIRGSYTNIEYDTTAYIVTAKVENKKVSFSYSLAGQPTNTKEQWVDNASSFYGYGGSNMGPIFLYPNNDSNKRIYAYCVEPNLLPPGDHPSSNPKYSGPTTYSGNSDVVKLIYYYYLNPPTDEASWTNYAAMIDYTLGYTQTIKSSTLYDHIMNNVTVPSNFKVLQFQPNDTYASRFQNIAIGYLKVTTTNPTEIIFRNKCTDESVVIVAKKILNNANIENYIFKFGIWEKGQENKEPLQVATNGSDGRIVFNNFINRKINNGEQFVIKEIPGNDPNITYDNTAYVVTAKVNNNITSFEYVLSSKDNTNTQEYWINNAQSFYGYGGGNNGAITIYPDNDINKPIYAYCVDAILKVPGDNNSGYTLYNAPSVYYGSENVRKLMYHFYNNPPTNEKEWTKYAIMIDYALGSTWTIGNKAEYENIINNTVIPNDFEVYEFRPKGLDSLIFQGIIVGYYYREDVSVDEIIFTNEYNELDKITITLNAFKTLNGKDLEDKEFEFQLIQNDVVIDTQTNNKEGNITFKTLTFTSPGSYYYIIKEVVGNVNGMVYDQTEYNIKIQVVKGNDNKLYSYITYFKGPLYKVGTTNIEFINTYNEIVETGVSLMVLPFILIFIGCIGVLVFFLVKKYIR